jgi:uncharacterized protein GlcG (DUF336 family)
MLAVDRLRKFSTSVSVRVWVGWAAALAAAACMGAPKMPFVDTPSGPKALPGDVIPPFGTVDAEGRFTPTPREVPPGFEVGPHRAPESTAPGPTLTQAMHLAAAALHACARKGYRVGVAVIDSEGRARVVLNADGTDGSHGFVAMRKAETALAFNMSSEQANELAQHDPSVLSRVTGAMLLDGGAVPLVAHGELIGAVGVSGAAGKIIGAQDEECARAGRDALVQRQKRLH